MSLLPPGSPQQLAAPVLGCPNLGGASNVLGVRRGAVLSPSFVVFSDFPSLVVLDSRLVCRGTADAVVGGVPEVSSCCCLVRAWPCRAPRTGSERLWGEDKATAGRVAHGRVTDAGVAALLQRGPALPPADLPR